MIDSEKEKREQQGLQPPEQRTWPGLRFFRGNLGAAAALVFVGWLLGLTSVEIMGSRKSSAATGFALAGVLAVVVWCVLTIRHAVRRLDSARDSAEKPAEPLNAVSSQLSASAATLLPAEDLKRQRTAPLDPQDGESSAAVLSESGQIPAIEVVPAGAPCVAVREPRAERLRGFPQSVRDYLEDLEERGVQKERVELRRLEPGILIAEPTGRLVLVVHVDSRKCTVVPAFERIQMGQQIRAYEEVFDCENPRSGDVWIIAPAVVVSRGVQGGWKLQEKGRLDVR